MTIALLLKLLSSYWREALIGVLVVALAGACISRDHRIASTAIAKEHGRQADSVLRVITPRLLHTDTVLVHDTVEVRHAVDRVITLRDTVLHHLSDTVLVREYVTRADSAAQACSELLNTCALYRAEATATIAALNAKVKAGAQIAPTTARRCGIGLSAGYGAVRAGGVTQTGPGAVIGLACRW